MELWEMKVLAREPDPFLDWVNNLSWEAEMKRRRKLSRKVLERMYIVRMNGIYMYARGVTSGEAMDRCIKAHREIGRPHQIVAWQIAESEFDVMWKPPCYVPKSHGR